MTTRTSIAAIALTIGLSGVGNAQIGAEQYDTWRANYGADCTRDGVLDQADYEVWRANYGATAGASEDINNDGLVNGTDYRQWRSGYGADLDCDGSIGRADYTIWRQTFEQ